MRAGDAKTGLELCAVIMAGVLVPGLRLAGGCRSLQGLSWPAAVRGCLSMPRGKVLP